MEVNSEKLKKEIITELNELLKQYDGELTAEGQQKLFEKFGAELTDKLTKDWEQKFGKVEMTLPQGDTSPQAMEAKYGFKSFNEFLFAVKDWRDPNHQAIWNGKAKALTTAGSGEFLIPQEWENQILSVALDSNQFFSRARKIPLKGNSVKLPYVINFDHYTAGQLFGGVIAYWTSEEGSLTASQPKFGAVELSLEKLTLLTPVTNEMLEDAPMGLPSFLQDIFGQVLNFKLEEKFINGNGAGEPLGIMNASAKSAVAKDTSQTASTITTGNLARMKATMYKGGKSRAIYIYGDDPKIYENILNAQIGTSYTPAFVPAGGYGNNTTLDRILGSPAVESEHMQAIGTEGDIIYVDPSQYLVAVKQNDNPKFDSSMHLYFDTDKTAFRLTYRCDGACWWKSALTTADNQTKSPIVTVAVRS